MCPYMVIIIFESPSTHLLSHIPERGAVVLDTCDGAPYYIAGTGQKWTPDPAAGVATGAQTRTTCSRAARQCCELSLQRGAQAAYSYTRPKYGFLNWAHLAVGPNRGTSPDILEFTATVKTQPPSIASGGTGVTSLRACLAQCRGQAP